MNVHCCSIQRRITSTKLEDAWKVPTIGQLPGRPRCLQDSFRQCDSYPSTAAESSAKALNKHCAVPGRGVSTLFPVCPCSHGLHLRRLRAAAKSLKFREQFLRHQLQDHPRSAARSAAWYLAFTSCSIHRQHDSAGRCLACLGKVGRLLASIFDACHEGAHLPSHGRVRATRLMTMLLVMVAKAFISNQGQKVHDWATADCL